MPMLPVTATQPMTGGSAPAAPPMTMFCGVAPLEDDRVDDDVEGDRQQRQEGRQQVHEPGHDRERDHAEHDPEDHRPLRLHLVCRERPPPGAHHQHVDVAVQVAVDRVGTAGRQRPADHRPEHEDGPGGPVRPARSTGARDEAGRQDHRGHGRDEQQFDDARLGQGDVRPDAVLPRVRRRLGRSPRIRARPNARLGSYGHAGSVVAVTARPTSIAQMTVPSARWSIWVQPARRREDLQAADDDLDPEQDRRTRPRA